MRFQIILALSFASLGPGVAYADRITGSQLLAWIEGAERAAHPDRTISDLSDQSSAIGYLTGIVEARAYQYCFPSSANLDQLMRIMEKNLRSNPETLHEPAFLLFDKEIRRVFPCKGRAGG